MHSRLRFWKYPILLVLLLLMTAAFTLIYTLSDTASAPHEVIEPPEPIVAETPEPPEIDEEPEPPDEDELLDEDLEDEVEDEPEDFHFAPEEDGFVTVHMDVSDIHRGYLILVNYENAFELPADLDLVNIVEEKTQPFRVLGQHYLLRRCIIEPLDEMMGAYREATGNNQVAIISAFRNYDSQQSILNQQIRLRGEREGRRWASEPGHSEHHTGLAFDFGVYAGGTRSTFTGTGVTSWFRRNSYRFGFIQRYPANKTRITRVAHEPWHFRYVGMPHSAILFHNNWAFEEYMEMLREHSIEEPFEAEVDGVTYLIYFSAGADVPVPLGSMFDISGNNVDGFIVTAYIPSGHEALLIDAMEDGDLPEEEE